MSAWIVVGGALLLFLLAVVVLVRQGSPASLSDEDGKTPRRERLVVDRPAGPDAERMDPDPTRGSPTGGHTSHDPATDS